MRSRALLFVVVSTLLLSGSVHGQERERCVERLGPKTSGIDFIFCLREVASELQVAREEISVMRYELIRTREETLPANAVLIVDDPRGCPRGWVSFSSADGRVIVGTRSSSSLSQTSPISEGTTPRKFREFGGQEDVTLTEAQMPEHDHGSEYALNGQPLPWGGGRYPVPTAATRSGSEYNWAEGANEAHPNMPPYIALYFCKKD